jgi:hypothetical protein
VSEIARFFAAPLALCDSSFFLFIFSINWLLCGGFAIARVLEKDHLTAQKMSAKVKPTPRGFFKQGSNINYRTHPILFI